MGFSLPFRPPHLSSLAGPGTPKGILEAPWELAQGPRSAKASSYSLIGSASTLPSWPGPQVPAFH